MKVNFINATISHPYHINLIISTRFPKYGWKVKLNHEFPERRDQNLQPSPTQMVQLLPLGLR